MCSWADAARVAAAGLLAMLCGSGQAAAVEGIGRVATPSELRAWDIDVRADFKGLPKGSGSVAQGQEIFESKCASCHGIFGDSGSVFSPLVGGTTAQDIGTGHVARLNDAAYPLRTTLMKLATVSTLWDYIHRAMPWTQPKSLPPDEVYAVSAYILYLGGIVPDDFVLSERNIAAVQARLPNRNGLTRQHDLWPGDEFGGSTVPDVPGTGCMKDCAGGDLRVVSSIPASALNAHGNLALQNRLVGEQRGIDTDPGASAHAATAPKDVAHDAALGIARRQGCFSCHDLQRQVVGPPFQAVAKRYAGHADAVSRLDAAIKAGSSGAWGAVPMPPQTVPDADRRIIAQWLAAGAPP